jgi:uncharacterized protein (TIGR02996 family)
MCATAKPFLSAIESAPNDDAPKLVYADWCDENDRPDEAEAIRAGVKARVRAARMVERKRDTAVRVWKWAMERADRLNLPCRHQLNYVTFSHAYAEPGYTEPESELIAFGNWNSVSFPVEGPPTQYGWRTTAEDNGPERLAELFERLGVAIEWADEWSTCSDCGKALRTSPDSYGWTPAYNEKLVEHGEFLCLECCPDEVPDEPEAEPSEDDDTDE